MHGTFSFFCSLGHASIAPASVLAPPRVSPLCPSSVRITSFSLLRTDRRPRSATHQAQNRVGCARTRISSQRLVDRGESLHQLIAIRTFELREHGGTEHVRAHIVVEVLRHDLTSREEIRLSEERSLEEFQALEQKTCQRT